MPDTPDTAFIEALRWLGLTEPEAKLFSILADTGGGTLAELSKATGQPRSTSHSALRALAKRGLIFCAGRYPARFSPAPVGRLETMVAVGEEKLRRYRSASEAVLRRLNY